MDTPKSDFEELFACLTARSVRYVVVGGHALAFHGRPRFTKHLDLFIEPTSDNAERLLLALGDFGFGGLGLTAADFSTTGRIVQLGVAPYRIDLITAIDGVEFGDAWAGQVQGRFGAQPVDYLGRQVTILDVGLAQMTQPGTADAVTSARRRPAAASGARGTSAATPRGWHVPAARPGTPRPTSPRR